eukprot:gene17887-biopygen21900
MVLRRRRLCCGARAGPARNGAVSPPARLRRAGRSRAQWCCVSAGSAAARGPIPRAMVLRRRRLCCGARADPARNGVAPPPALLRRAGRSRAPRTSMFIKDEQATSHIPPPQSGTPARGVPDRHQARSPPTRGRAGAPVSPPHAHALLRLLLLPRGRSESGRGRGPDTPYNRIPKKRTRAGAGSDVFPAPSSRAARWRRTTAPAY